MKQLLREVFTEVLARVQVDAAFARHADALRTQLVRPQVVIAFGKAARQMATAVRKLAPDVPMRGLVVPLALDDAELTPFEVIPGGHPLPDQGSLRAGARALELAASATGDEDLLFLVSGGGSAMLEQPADPAVTLAELRALNRALVGSGADIGDINTVRRHLSATKGGRLALAGGGARQQLTLAISDVPAVADGDNVRSLASGPTVPDPTTIADCRRVLEQYELWSAVPPSLRARLERGDLPPPLSPEAALCARSEVILLLSQRDAAAAALRLLRTHSVVAVEVPEVDDWPYEQAAVHLLERLEQLHEAHPGQRVAVVTTGELSVPLPAEPGVGGRNQQFVLACAERIADRPIAVLSCGTDGVDGVAPAAGAVADGATIERALAAGLDPTAHLRGCDAHPLFEALADAVVTGPSGTNVRDVRVLLRDA